MLVKRYYPAKNFEKTEWDQVCLLEEILLWRKRNLKNLNKETQAKVILFILTLNDSKFEFFLLEAGCLGLRLSDSVDRSEISVTASKTAKVFSGEFICFYLIIR